MMRLELAATGLVLQEEATPGKSSSKAGAVVVTFIFFLVVSLSLVLLAHYYQLWILPGRM